MLKFNKLNFNTLLILILLSSSIYISAQEKNNLQHNITVKNLSELYPIYQEKHLVICKEIEKKTNLSFIQKLAIYENEVNKLKDFFKKERKSEYLSIEITKAKRYNCTGTHIRNITPCKPVYVNAPENMYTKEDWVKIESDDSATIVLHSSFVSLSMNAVGKRTYKGVIRAKFKYKPKNIVNIVNEETIDLFSKMFED